MTLSMKQLVKRQKGRPTMAKQNRRTMQIRLSVDEQTITLDALERERRRIVQIDGDIRQVDILIERVAELKTRS